MDIGAFRKSVEKLQNRSWWHKPELIHVISTGFGSDEPLWLQHQTKLVYIYVFISVILLI